MLRKRLLNRKFTVSINGSELQGGYRSYRETRK